MQQATPQAAAATAPPSVPHFDHVDALRGIAVLLVVMAHVSVPRDVLVLNEIGAYGVQLFFIISAFTLFLSMASRSARDTYPPLFFAIRRFFRIAPAFYLAAAFYLLKDGLGPGPWAPDGIHAWQIVATLLFLHGWHPFSFNAIVPGGWSIAAEMTFYLFVPLCFALITNMYRAFAMAIILGFLAVVVNHFAMKVLVANFAQYSTPLYWFSRLWFPAQACVFPVGFALYFLCDRKTGRMRDGPRILASIIAGVAVSLVLWKLRLAQIFLPVAFVLAAFVYIVMRYRPWPIVNPVLCYIGKISFSVYLFHFWGLDLIEKYLAPVWKNAEPHLASSCFYACAVAFSCIIATVTHKLVEEPGQSLGRAIINRLRARRLRES